MKKLKTLILCLSIIVVSSVWTPAEIVTDENLSKQIEELKIQVEMLKKRIKSLEKELQSLAHRSVVIPETFPKLQQIPKGWEEYEFNGMNYYIIPLKADSKKTSLQKK